MQCIVLKCHLGITRGHFLHSLGLPLNILYKAVCWRSAVHSHKGILTNVMETLIVFIGLKMEPTALGLIPKSLTTQEGQIHRRRTFVQKLWQELSLQKEAKR